MMLVDGLTLLIAFTSTAVLGPPVQLAHRTGMIDQPAVRKLHLNPTPLLGALRSIW